MVGNWTLLLVVLAFLGVPLFVFLNGFVLQTAAGMADVPAERTGYLKCTGVGILVLVAYSVFSLGALAFAFLLNRRSGFPSAEHLVGFSQVLAAPVGLAACGLLLWPFFRVGFGKSLFVQIIHALALVLLAFSLWTLFVYGGYWVGITGQLLGFRP
jgi:hypothetical protein